MSKYYVLLSLESGSWHWSVEFGDYDKKVVQAELDDYRDRGIRRSNLHILTVNGDTQADIDKAVAEFNDEYFKR